MARKNEMTGNPAQHIALLAAALIATLLGACTGWTPPAQVSSQGTVETGAPEPESQGGEGVQVFPLQNPAVKELLADASSAKSVGDYGKAALLLERALRIEPRDPEILQSMAEVQLQSGDYEQALNFAVRSYDSGPRVGEICNRNWHTIGAARQRLGDHAGSVEAGERAASCLSARPERL